MTLGTKRNGIMVNRPGNLGRRGTDVMIAVLAVGFAMTALAFDLDDGSGVTAGSYVVAALVSGALVVRRNYPLAVVIVVVLGRWFVTWDAGSELALMPAAAVALYTMARQDDRRTGLITASLAAIAMGVVTAFLGDEAFLLELVGELAQGFLPIALADANRSRADRMRELIDSEAESRVQAERLRIARDLHDVVAHGLSTIAVQSGVAAHLLDRDPSQAREALEIINSTGKASLEELRTMVGVLRSTDSAELRPVPADPDDLGELIAAARRAGVDVSCQVSGAFPESVSEAAVVAVHRIVQEALVNVARHAGPVETNVSLNHLDDGVVVEIDNAPPTTERSTIASSGIGIIGLRERAESIGGSLDAGPTLDGGFQVTATVPYLRTDS